MARTGRPMTELTLAQDEREQPTSAQAVPSLRPRSVAACLHELGV